MDFSENLKKARKAAGMKQIELSEKAGISVNAVRLYEAGKTVPNLDTLAKLARAMGLYASDLIDDDQWKNVPMGPGDAWTAESTPQQNKQEARLLQHFRTLNDDGQTVAVDRVEELAQIPKYQRAQNAPQDAPAAPDDKEPTEK